MLQSPDVLVLSSAVVRRAGSCVEMGDNGGMGTAGRTVANWIKQFSDQRLAEVLAFNDDGKMNYNNPCSCLLGVTLAVRLHTKCGQDYKVWHYRRARALPGGPAAEVAYFRLGMGFPKIIRWRLSRLLKAEMRLRERLRATHLYHGDVPLSEAMRTERESPKQKVNDTEAPKRHDELVSA